MNPTELTRVETTLNKTPQENGVMMLLLTHPYPKNSLPVDTPKYLASPTSCTHEDASDATRLSRERDLDRSHLMANDGALFDVYQDWVHHKPFTHLDGGIGKDCKCQAILKTLVCLTTKHYDVPSVQVTKRFVSTLAAELDGIRSWKWNAEWEIVFQTVILQCVRLVTGTKNICIKINT